MPPPMMTNVAPTVTTPITDALTRMFRRLSVVRKFSLVSDPTTIRTARTATSPRLRTSVVRSRDIRLCTSVRSRNGAPVPVCSLTWTPFHHQVEYPVLIEFARGGLVHDPALAHDQHPVGQAEYLRYLAGHQQHADPVV